MSCWDVNSSFINVPLMETIDFICEFSEKQKKNTHVNFYCKLKNVDSFLMCNSYLTTFIIARNMELLCGGHHLVHCSSAWPWQN